ncbi:purine nucleoside phosphorylase isoform X2 [Leptinotarsa decemlineata]|uniref:purine nucleoside phosphorylase isoform X2 n=1 Tax=Leptinotarsa decemlineata TaxID=7539 RepID=UPI000C252F32|nr:purine nucleoside phosphorylase isoform X2 [Leptinotarsa decemlineata]
MSCRCKLAQQTTGVSRAEENSNKISEKISIGSPNDDLHKKSSFLIDKNGYTYESVVATAEFLKKLVPFSPVVGIICGSGMGSLADSLQDKIVIPYEDIPNFPRSTVKGHAGALVFGYLSNVPVVCMKGRFHYYEGYPLWKCAMPVRVMKLLGANHLIATNAAGGLNPNFRVGDVMLVKDHINLMGFAGNNPLQGPNDERFGPRFPPMNQAYDKDLIKEAKNIAKEVGLGDNIHEGVYTCLGGPNFETVAELNMLKMLGADTVGMSTVHEVITAIHCNMTVLAFSLITNECITDYECRDNPNHEEVIDVGKMRENVLGKFVQRIVEHIAKTKNE